MRIARQVKRRAKSITRPPSNASLTPAIRQYVTPDRFEPRHVQVSGASRIITSESGATLNVGVETQRFFALSKDFFIQEEAWGERIIGQSIVSGAEPIMRLRGLWFSLCHPSAGNWMHWLSEVLPSVTHALESHREKTWGLLLDEGLPRQALESLEAVLLHQLAVELRRHSAVQVDQLIMSQTGWQVAWTRRGDRIPGDHAFDCKGLRSLREAVLSRFECKPIKRQRLSVMRTSTLREPKNASRLGESLQSRGFQSVVPGNLSFQTQVEIFSQAEVVVAQAGAELANMMFMPAGSLCIVLVCETIDVSLEYFSEYAEIFDLEFAIVSCPAQETDNSVPSMPWTEQHPLNSKFIITEDSIAEVENLLNAHGLS